MFNWFKNLRVGLKIGLGFGVLGVIFVGNILLILNIFNQTKELNDRVIELRNPTAINSLMMLNGLNRSISALRGWLLLGEDHFKQERQQAWLQNIELPRKKLQELSRNWTNPDNVERLEAVSEYLEKLRILQTRIESLSRTDGWAKANAILSEEAVPIASAITLFLGEMAKDQRQLLQADLDESKRLSKNGIRMVVATLLVSTSLGFLIAIPIAISITRPLRRITEFSKKVANGELGQNRIKRDSNDEFGVLTHNINTMVFGLIANLQEKEARNFALVYNILDPLIEIDERGIIEIFNPAAERVFGYSATEVMGKNIKILMPEPYYSEHDGYLQNYLETKNPQIIGIGREVVGKRKDGSTFPMDLSVNELKVKGKRMYVGVCRDISESKKSEKKLADSRLTLEKEYWVKKGLADLHQQMRGDQEEVVLAQNIINYLAKFLKVQIGAIYLSQNQQMQFAAGYAYNQGMKLSYQYRSGEGLVGQSVLEKKSILVTDLPDDSVRIQSGLINAHPRSILVTPIVFEDEVVGVVELASLDEIRQDQRSFLDQATEPIAINLHSARSRARLAEFLNAQKIKLDTYIKKQYVRKT